MKIAILLAGSRAGSDFFASLLDGHSQICQFPGDFVYDQKLKKIFNLDPNLIPDEFIKLFPHFFNSRLNKRERHDKLGKNKNEFYVVDELKFKKRFISNLKLKKASKINLLLNLHESYSFSSNDRGKKKLILINVHLIEWAKIFFRDFRSKEIEIIYTTRYPLSGLSSPLKDWLEYKPKAVGPDFMYYHIELVLNGINMITKFKKKIHVVKLENLHQENVKTMKNFCRAFNLKYENSLKYSTFFKKKWWGDKSSKKYLDGVNKKFKISYEKSYFYKRDVSNIEQILHKELKVLKYPRINKYPEKKSIFLPMKIELIILINLFKFFKIKSLIKFFYYFLKRIFLIYQLKSQKFLVTKI